MLRLIIIFILIYIAGYIFGWGNTSILFLVYVMLASFGITIISYLMDILRAFKENGYSEETVGRYFYKLGEKHKLPRFNDILADEIMKIRSELTEIRVAQRKFTMKQYNSLYKAPENFIARYCLLLGYPSSAICTFYKTPKDKEGRIIILLEDIPGGSIANDEEYDLEKLRRMKSFKSTKIKKGMHLSVDLWEPKMKSHPEYDRDAEVLSIEDDDSYDYGDKVLTLKIYLDKESDHSYPVSEEDIEKSKIIRKIPIQSLMYSGHWLEFDE